MTHLPVFVSTLCAVVLFSLLGNDTFALAHVYPRADDPAENMRILVPVGGEVWNVGDLRTVEWRLDGIALNDSQGKPVVALLSLSYDSGIVFDPVIIAEPLASGFNISQGMINIIVPEVPTRKDYTMFLSADIDGVVHSDPITIFNPKDPQGTGAAPSSIAVSSAPPISQTVVLPSNTTSAPTASSTSSSTSSSPSPTQTSTSSSTKTNAARALSLHGCWMWTWTGAVLAATGLLTVSW